MTGRCEEPSLIDPAGDNTDVNITGDISLSSIASLQTIGQEGSTHGPLQRGEVLGLILIGQTSDDKANARAQADGQ